MEEAPPVGDPPADASDNQPANAFAPNLYMYFNPPASDDNMSDSSADERQVLHQQQTLRGEQRNMRNPFSIIARRYGNRLTYGPIGSEQDGSISNSGSSVIGTSEETGPDTPPGTQQKPDEIVPQKKEKKTNSPKPPEDEENDGETCPICLDSWANSGDHRLVALKCGHLFGLKCVEKWLRGKETMYRCCPTCKTKASLKDIRHIYAKKLVAVDMTEVVALQNQVETVQMEKHKIQEELQATRLANHTMGIQLDLLRKTVTNNAIGRQSSKRNWRFSLDKNLDVWKDGGCRVLAYNCRTYDFYVSQKATNNLFPGFGVRPVSCIDYKLGSYIPLHSKAIRDVAYSQPTDLLMTIGLDGVVRIIERGIPTTSKQCALPLWSCTWDYTRPFNFYLGCVGGHILCYDLRNMNAAVTALASPGDLSPNVQLTSTEYGLLSCQLNSAWLWTSTVANAKPQPVPVKGPFVSMCYDHDSRRVAVTGRPVQSDRGKIALYRLNRNYSGEVSFELQDIMFGSSRSQVMSRGSFVKCADSTWVAAYSESDAALVLHPVDGSRPMSLPAAEAALDICVGQVNGDVILAALSESKLRVYKAHPVE